jgi:hypothetical protein
MSTIGFDDPADAQKVMSEFLTAAMPDIERCLPDWKAVNALTPTTKPAP